MLKENDESEMQCYELDDNPEIVGQQLSQALGNLSNLGIGSADDLVKDHTIGGSQDCKLKFLSLNDACYNLSVVLNFIPSKSTLPGWLNR